MENISNGRDCNFNEHEKVLLVDLVKDSLDIIENKKTGAVTAQEKELAWNRIATRFNPLSQTGERTSAQLYSLYMSLKEKAHKDKASGRAEINKTGVEVLDVVSEKIISMIPSQFTPLQNPYDSSAPLYRDIPGGEILDESLIEAIPVETVEVVIDQSLDGKQKTAEQTILEELQQSSHSPPMKRRHRIQSSSLREITDRVGKRISVKNYFDQVIHNMRVEVIRTELQIKKRLLEKEEIELESAKLDLEKAGIELESAKLNLEKMKKSF